MFTKYQLAFALTCLLPLSLCRADIINGSVPVAFASFVVDTDGDGLFDSGSNTSGIGFPTAYRLPPNHSAFPNQEARGVFEMSFATYNIGVGSVVLDADLAITEFRDWWPNAPVSLFGYSPDGTTGISKATAAGVLLASNIAMGDGQQFLTVDVTSYLQTLINAGKDTIGFRIEAVSTATDLPGYTLDMSSTGLSFTIGTVPEPGSVLLLLSSGLFLLRRDPSARLLDKSQTNKPMHPSGGSAAF